MNSEQKARRDLVLKIIYLAFVAILLFVVMTCSISFTLGHLKKYDEQLDDYKDGINHGFVISNLENLTFLQTDDVVEYKTVFKKALKDNDLYKKVKNVIVLDTIAKQNEVEQYEWYSVCDDKEKTTFINNYDANSKGFTISKFDKDEEDAGLTDEQVEKIQIKDEESDDNYVNGSVSDIEAINPKLSNTDELFTIIRNNETELLDSFRKFLVETENNRRNFTVIDNSIKQTDSTVSCTFGADVELSNNNIIKMTYSKSDRTFVFDYAN